MTNNRDHTPLIVLAVSQDIASRLEQDCPETDFHRLARVLGACVVGNSGYASNPHWSKLERATAMDISQAIHILRRYPHADCYVSFSERVGLAMGFLLRLTRKRTGHVLIAHRLNTKAKRALAMVTGWHKGISRIVTLCMSQDAQAHKLVGERAQYIKACVTDDAFFRPSQTNAEPYVLSVGNEQRDYDTLISAAREANVPLRIVGSSPWSRRAIRPNQADLSGVEFLGRVSYAELRDLYNKATAVALPLHDVDYAAGHNGILEAICMTKPLVVSASRGIIDYVEHNNNALVVAPGDVSGTAQALLEVCRNVSLRARLVQGTLEARNQWARLDMYVEALRGVVVKVIHDA